MPNTLGPPVVRSSEFLLLASPRQVATKDQVLIVRPDVTLDYNTNVRQLRTFNKFKTTIVSKSLPRLCPLLQVILVKL